MKWLRILLVLSVLLSTEKGMAQLTQTKWEGLFAIPVDTECYLHFKSDTVYLLFKEGNRPIEAMTYKLKADTLTLAKIDGSSPCATSDIGIYTWKIANDKLILNLLSDDCPDRSGAFLTGELHKVVDTAAMKKE